MGLLDKAYGVYKEAIPMDYRFYLQGLLGDKEKPFTEKDLTEDELNIILNQIDKQSGETVEDIFSETGETITEARTNSTGKKNTKDKGRVEYSNSNDYTVDNELARTLGNFRYKTNEQDSNYYQVNDLYNFYNPMRKETAEYYESLDGLDKVKEVINQGVLSDKVKDYELDKNKRIGGLRGLLYPIASEVGMAYMGRDNSTPVNIKIKKRK